MAEMTYTVEVTREGDAWIADVIDLPGARTFARNLTALHRSVREVIALVDNVRSVGDGAVTYHYVGVDDDLAQAAELGVEREALETRQRQLADEAAIRIATLTAKGYSVRDISGALKMSPGRVSQIMAARRAS
jgi:hypothetical protein